MTNTDKRRAGFTLMELLIVLAILIALLALLLPAVFNQRARWKERQANFKIGQLGGFLEDYATENNGYPTNEQGLFALIYIPDNVGVLPTIQPGGAMGTGTDPSLYGGMAGGSGSIGPESLMTPQTDPTAMSGSGAAVPGGMEMPMSDPTGVGGGGMTSTWTQYVHNPQIYLQQRKRSNPYVTNEKGLLDPWDRPYRYDNSQQYYGFNITGSTKPAIWSAGPDGVDGTDDDLRNWDPVEAQQAIALRQQQMQNQQGMGGGMDGMTTIDPTGGMGGMQPPGGGMMPPGSGMTPPGGGMMPPGGGMMPPGGGMQPPGGGMTPPGGGMMPPGGGMMPPGGGMMPPGGGMMPPGGGMTPPGGGMTPPGGGMTPPPGQ